MKKIRGIIRLADDRKAALDAALKKIEKNYGKGAIMKLGEKVDHKFRRFQVVHWLWMLL